MNNSILKKERALSLFQTKKELFAILLVILPNLIFWFVSWFSGIARPILNLDYIIAAILFLLPWKPLRILGALGFWLVLLFDVLMLIMQQFPFMDLIGAIYLFPFIFKAPTLYQVLAAILLGYAIIMPLVLQKIANKTNILHLFIFVAPLIIIAYFTSNLQYYKRPTQADIFGTNNFYYARSQYLLYQESQDTDFLKSARTEPVFLKLGTQQRAATNLNNPLSDRILFIVNESWGQPKNQPLQNAVLENILKQNNLLSDFKIGSFQFIGATVEGELRELCSYGGARGYFFRRSSPEKFAQCLPNNLKKQGYQTFSIHGAENQLYDRFSWYPKAGFSNIKTAENLTGKKTCEAFGGVCDSELFNEVKDGFKKSGKIFYYWLTLTTHSDYPEKDLFNHRLNCEQYGLKKDTDLCRNFKLQTQFFDGLAELIKQPEMKGVEVLVVGDHSPPTVNIGETLKYMQEGHVAWVHFKVK